MTTYQSVSTRIDFLYRQLDDIRKNINIHTRRYGTNQYASAHQANMYYHRTIEAYTKMYSCTLQHIEYLYTRHAEEDPSPPLDGNYAFVNGQYYHIESVEHLNLPPRTPRPTSNRGPRQSPPATPHPSRSARSSLNPYASSFRNTHTTPHSSFRYEPPQAQAAGGGGGRPFSASFPSIFDTFAADLLAASTADPVIVRPSEEQIQNATITRPFAEVQDPINNQCPISLEQFCADSSIIQICHCRHIFNPPSLAEWFRFNVRCPVCRYDIRDAESPSSSVDSAQAPHTTTPRTGIDHEETDPLQTSLGQDAGMDMDMDTDMNTEGDDLAHLTNVIGTFLQNMDVPIQPQTTLDPNRPLAPQLPSVEATLNSLLQDTATQGSQIIHNLLTNNIDNIRFDPSSNSLSFETFVYDASGNTTT